MISPLDAQRIVCLTFDDLWKSQVETCWPVLLERGFRATFYVPNNVFVEDRWYGRLAGPETIFPIFDSGMEIGSHLYHQHPYSCTFEELHQKLMDVGVPVPVTYAYPSFKMGLPAIAEARGLFVASRGGTQMSRSPGYARGPAHTIGSEPDPKHLHPVFCTSVFGLKYGSDQLKVDLETKIMGKDVGILCLHNIGPPFEGIGGPVNLPLDEFVRSMDFLDEPGTATIALWELAALAGHPFLETPYRSPRAISGALRPWIEGRHICELGAACGDNLLHFLWDGRARRVSGIEKDRKRVKKAKSRGLLVDQGSFYDPLPEAEIYYCWHTGKTSYEIAKHARNYGPIIIGADDNVGSEIRAVRDIAKNFDGQIIEVPFNEGTGHRQHGNFLLAICPKNNQ